jgi:hypothetical protein
MHKLGWFAGGHYGSTRKGTLLTSVRPDVVTWTCGA